MLGQRPLRGVGEMSRLGSSPGRPTDRRQDASPRPVTAEHGPPRSPRRTLDCAASVRTGHDGPSRLRRVSRTWCRWFDSSRGRHLLAQVDSLSCAVTHKTSESARSPTRCRRGTDETRQHGLMRPIRRRYAPDRTGRAKHPIQAALLEAQRGALRLKSRL